MSGILGHAGLLFGATSGPPPLPVNDYYQGHIYTGDGLTSRLIAGPDISAGGLSMFKRRDSAGNFTIDYTPNGSSPKRAQTNGTLLPAASPVTFGATGTSMTDASYNTSAGLYMNWAFKKAARFVDVVTYTGNGANRTIAHALGVTPGFMLIFCTSNATGAYAYHKDIGPGSYAFVNSSGINASATEWNSTNPTSSVFSLGTSTLVNQNTRTYVAFLFAHDTASDGIIQACSWTGNASTSGPTITLGWQPQYLWVPADTNSASHWLMDQTRTPGFTGAEARVSTESNGVESTSGDVIALVSNGFQVVSSSIINASAKVYYGLAIRAP